MSSQSGDDRPGISTSASLLSGLRNPNNRQRYEASWKRFCAVYTPIMYTWCRQKNLSHHDAEDVTNEMMGKLSESLQEFAYDQSLSFRGWLHQATIHSVISFWRGAKPVTLLEQQALDLHRAPEELTARLEREFDRELEQEARRRVRLMVSDRDWEIFCALTETPATPVEVSQRFELGRGTVDQVKYKIVEALKNEIQRLHEYGIG